MSIVRSMSVSDTSWSSSSARIGLMKSSDAFLFKVEDGGGMGFMSSCKAREDRVGCRSGTVGGDVVESD